MIYNAYFPFAVTTESSNDSKNMSPLPRANVEIFSPPKETMTLSKLDTSTMKRLAFPFHIVTVTCRKKCK